MRRVRVGWRVVKEKVPVYAGVGAGLGALAEMARRVGGLRSLGGSHLLNAPAPPDGSVDALIEAEKRSQGIIRQEGMAADAPLVSSTVNPLTELGKALVEGAKFGKDMANGFFLDGVLESIKGSLGFLKGVISSVTHPVRTVRSVSKFVASMRRISFLSRTWQLWKSQIGWYKRTWQSPHYGRAVGKALFEALMISLLVAGLYSKGAESLSWLSRERTASEITEVEAVESQALAGQYGEEASRLIKTLPPSTRTRLLDLAEQAVKEPQADAVLIGKYFRDDPSLSYEQLGKQLGFTHLNLEEPSWSEFTNIVNEYNLGEDAWWKLVNEPFIRKVAQSGKPVYVNVNPDGPMAETGNLYKEIRLLKDLGYKPKGKVWVTVEGKKVELWEMTK